MQITYEVLSEVIESYFNGMLIRQPGTSVTSIYRTNRQLEHRFTTLDFHDSLIREEVHPEEIQAVLRRLDITIEDFINAVERHLHSVNRSLILGNQTRPANSSSDQI